MAKSANKNRSEIEFLKGEVRRLRKQLTRIKKGDSNIKIKENDLYNEEFEDENFCPSCGKGTLFEVDLKYIIVTNCNVCEYTDKRKAAHAKEKT